MSKRKDFDNEGLPLREGVYLARGFFGFSPRQAGEIDVYLASNRGLCCFRGAFDYLDIGRKLTEEDNVHVKNTKLKFIKRTCDL